MQKHKDALNIANAQPYENPMRNQGILYTEARTVLDHRGSQTESHMNTIPFIDT